MQHSIPMVQAQGRVEIDGRSISLDEPPKPIPPLWMWLRGLYGGKGFKIKAVLDSGAMMSRISLEVIQENKVPLNITNIGYKVKYVRKNSAPHQEMADFEATSNGIKTAIRVVVSDNIWDNMLITYQDYLKFNVIHANFPYEVLTYSVTADILAKIKHCFSDVMSEDLNPTPMKNPMPMTISLKDNAKPLKVLAARRVPRQFEEPAEDDIQDLIKYPMSRIGAAQDSSSHQQETYFRQYLMTPSTSSRWMPFTDISNWLSLRTVPCSQPFSYNKEKVSQSPNRPQRFLGWMVLSFRQNSHGTAVGQEIVDDTIIWAPTLEELQESATIILERCCDRNITIYLKKLELRKEITFAGHIICQARIRPAEFPTPTNVLQLWSFLGLANQLKAFVPDLAHMTAALQPLLEKRESDRRHGKGIQAGQVVTNYHDNCPAVQSKPKINFNDGRIKAFWNRICSFAATPRRKMVPDSMWLSISYAHPDQICHHRAGVHGHPVGYSEMFILSPRIGTFEVCTDHKPLVGIFQKSICDLDTYPI